MKALLKCLVLVVIFMAVLFTAYILRLPEASQKALLRDINIAIAEKKLPENLLRNWLGKVTEVKPSKAQPSFEDIRQANKKALPQSQEYFQQASCYKAPTEKLTTRKQAIYRFQDANGRWHFSDQKTENSEDISQSLASKKDYFKLNFIYHGHNLPAFLKTQITTHVEQSYQFLAGFIPKNNLRKVTLNIQLFENPEDFNAYRLEIAPEAKTQSGFYSLRHNQAVVQQQKSDRATLSIALHEASHILMASLFGQTPVWLNEGFAEFNERLFINGQQKTIKPSLHYWRMLSSSAPDIKLWDYNHLRFYQLDDKGLNYATSWSLVYFLLQQSPQTFQAMLTQLLQTPCAPLDAKAIIAAHYPGYSQFLKDWHTWRQSEAPNNYYY